MSITPLAPDAAGSVLDEDAFEEDDLDVDAGRHFDDGLVLLGALEQVLADHVSRLRDAVAEPALRELADAELLGMPTSVVVGRGLADGMVELRDRKTGTKQEIPVESAVEVIAAAIRG